MEPPPANARLAVQNRCAVLNAVIKKAPRSGGPESLTVAPQLAQGRRQTGSARNDFHGSRTLEQQAQPQGRWLLRAARAAHIDPHRTKIRRLDGVPNEVRQVIAGHPVPEVGRQQQGGIVIDVDEAGTQTAARDWAEGLRVQTPLGNRNVRQAGARRPALAACPEPPERSVASAGTEIQAMPDRPKSDRLLAGERARGG